MKRPVMIISHRRSGSHFLFAALKLNFKVEERWDSRNRLMPFRVHSPFSDEALQSFIQKRTCIYLVRDARNTLVSCYYYWRAIQESSYAKVHDVFNQISFDQYLRGEAVIFGKELYGEDFELPQLFSDPIGHWLSYPEWANKVFTVRYEDLLTSYEESIISIGNYIGRRPVGGVVKPVGKFVGNVPDVDVTRRDWKNHFYKEDLDYFWSIAGEKMLELGYAKDDVGLPERFVPEPMPEPVPEVIEIKAEVKPEGWFTRIFKKVRGLYKRG